ncbi:hypothetical protein CAPTEDRAFT_213188 [Capitella teleta]|uniref:Mitochondrial uncoupling protein 4 n=1 Tax=Capitella teleta TaxID=283909 RepID=R7VFJ9_CAPTE|nr:hypothetical protein CAPTEDRAFT_213188 [Capitella teleta]|eukprot:ELU15076.1 hypothetical protein CAPTEDRAFT_213188 [Capitella teleta]
MTENSSAPKKETFVFKYALSCCAATVAESVTYPMDLTKTRLQIQGEGGLATAKKRGFIRTAYGIATEEGVHKLWQGVTPAVYRHYVYTGCRLGFYEYIRENFLGKNTDGTFSLWKAVVSGMTAGALAQFIASPMDLVKVQMQMEGRRLLEGQKPRYKGTLHAFTSIAKQGGVRGLWRGWIPNVQRAALVNLGDLTTYDTAKHLILVNTSLPDAPLLHSIASACSGLISAVLSTPADVVKTRIMNREKKRSYYYTVMGAIAHYCFIIINLFLRWLTLKNSTSERLYQVGVTTYRHLNTSVLKRILNILFLREKRNRHE